MDRILLVVTGRVQGVGFRWYVVQAAKALGLTGTVRNRADGAVEVEAEGERDALERLLETVREGPAMATVGQVQANWSQGPGRFPDVRNGRDR